MAAELMDLQAAEASLAAREARMAWRLTRWDLAPARRALLQVLTPVCLRTEMRVRDKRTLVPPALHTFTPSSRHHVSAHCPFVASCTVWQRSCGATPVQTPADCLCYAMCLRRPSVAALLCVMLAVLSFGGPRSSRDCRR